MPASTKRSNRKTSARGPHPPAAKPLINDERRLDILGICLVIVGFLTLICLSLGQPATLPGLWALILRQLFGIGAWIIPAVIAAPGVYMVLRHYRSALTVPGADRILGMTFLFFGGLTLVHLLTVPQKENIVVTPFSGGLVGGGLLYILLNLVDYAGTVLVLAAWLLIAVMLTFRVSIPELADRLGTVLGPIGEFLRRKWAAFLARRRVRAAAAPARQPAFAQTPASALNAPAPAETRGQPNPNWNRPRQLRRPRRREAPSR